MSLTQADVLERRVTRERTKRERGLRVTILNLPRCDSCHGTTEDVEDESLRCVCAARSAELRARLTRILHDHNTAPEFDLGDRLVP